MRTIGTMRGFLVGLFVALIFAPGFAFASDVTARNPAAAERAGDADQLRAEPSILSPVVGARDEVQASESTPWAVRSRVVELDLDVLRHAALNRHDHPSLSWQLFDDTTVSVDTHRVEIHEEGFTIHGVVPRTMGGFSTIAVHRSAVSGFISIPRVGRFTIRSAGNGLYRVTQVDPGAMPTCGVGPQHGGGIPGIQVPEQQAAQQTEPIVVTLLALFTEGAAEAAGGEDGPPDPDTVIADIIADVGTLNEILHNSQTNVEVKLLGPYLVDYDEGGDPGADLNALRNEEFAVMGFPYNHQDLRAVYCADLVTMIVSHEESPICGIAFIMPSPSAMNFETGFSVVRWECMPGTTLAHEVGHNMGCAHDHQSSGGGGGTYSFSHGHRYFVPTGALTPDPDEFDLYATVMSYPPYDEEVPFFSNPLIEYPAGHPTGIFPGTEGEADNAFTIVLNAPFFSQYGEMLGNDLCFGLDTIIDVPDDYPTIQAAIDAAEDGNIIRVAAGTYNERIDMKGKAVHLRSHTPGDPNSDVVVIDGGGLGSVVKVRSGEGLNTIINGFTIRGGGNVPHGGGVYISGSSPTVANVIIEDNVATTGGGGMYIQGGQPSVIRATFEDNFSQMRGGAVYIAGGAPIFISDCVFRNNQATLDGGAIYGLSSNFAMLDATFEGNSGVNRGGAVSVTGGAPFMQRVTFDSNTANFMGGGVYSSSSNMVIFDSTFIGNTASSQGGAVHVLGGDPLLDDITFTNNHVTAPTSRGGALYTRDSTMTLVESQISGNSAVASGGGVFIFVDSSLPEQSWVRPRFGTTTICDNSPNNITGPFINLGGTIICQDDMDHFVCPDPANPGTCVGCSFSSIQAAIDAANSGDVIVVCEGVYHEMIDFDGKAVHLRSLTPTDPAVVAATILDGQDQHRLFLFENLEGPSSRVSGLTIRNGRALNGGGMLIRNNSGPMIEHCVFEDNTATSLGGAVANFQSHATFVNNRFQNNNAATNGGAMYNQSSDNVIVIECEFEDNHAGGAGGGVANQASSISLTSVEFFNNTASTWGGGLFNSGSSPNVFDCDFRANTANEGGGIMSVANSEPGVAGTFFCENDPTPIGGPWNDFGGNVFDPVCPIAASSPMHAQPLSGESGSIVASFTGATNDGSSSCDPDGVDVFFLYEVTDGPKSLLLDTCGSSGDTAVSVFDVFFSELGCSTTCGGDPCGHPDACLYLPGLESGTYLIRVSLVTPFASGGAPGQFTLNYSSMDYKPGDLNGDGAVDGADLLILLSSWGQCVHPSNCPADLSGDGVVDGQDLLILLSNWG